MIGLDLVLVALFAIPVIWVARWERRTLRRRRLMARPFPEAWQELLARNVALYRMLPASLVPEVHGLIHVLLDEKRVEGCGGLAITDEVRLTIFGQAALLLIGRKPHFFPRADAILVYPHAYVVERAVQPNTVNVGSREVRLGESWLAGLVVLAWDHTAQTMIDVRGGHNVVLHEFAHQLDQEDGRADGTPPIGDRAFFAQWVAVMSREYLALCHAVEEGGDHLIDAYGATNEAEFFAVSTEVFFEKPQELKQRHPELYDLLRCYYRLDPVSWGKTADASSEHCRIV